MKPEQQHHIRNGTIAVRVICAALLKDKYLNPAHKRMIGEMAKQAERVERAANGEGIVRQKSWMTKTGNVLLGLGAMATALSIQWPVEEHRGWLASGGIVAAGIGQILANRGIRRRIAEK